MKNQNNFFNLDDLEQGIQRQLAEGISTRIFPGDQAMLSVVTLAADAVGTLHSHAEEQWGVMLEGEAVRIQDGKEVPVRAGDFWRTPGGVEHSVRAGPQGARILDIFSPPREIYKTSGSGFGTE